MPRISSTFISARCTFFHLPRREILTGNARCPACRPVPCTQWVESHLSAYSRWHCSPEFSSTMGLKGPFLAWCGSPLSLFLQAHQGHPQVTWVELYQFSPLPGSSLSQQHLSAGLCLMCFSWSFSLKISTRCRASWDLFWGLPSSCAIPLSAVLCTLCCHRVTLYFHLPWYTFKEHLLQRRSCTQSWERKGDWYTGSVIKS